MKPIVIGLITSLLFTAFAGAGEQPSSKLTVTTPNSRAVSFTNSKDLTVKFWLQQLALSALYRDVIAEASAEEWAQAEKSPSKIHCVYPPQSHIAIPERQLLTFEEIVVPFTEEGYPAYIFLKHGGQYLRLAKYDPWILWKLKVEAGLADEMPGSVPRTLF